MLARLQMRVRPVRQQPTPHRGMRNSDRVVMDLRPLAPAVEDAQHERIGTRAADHRTTSSADNLYTRHRARRDSRSCSGCRSRGARPFTAAEAAIRLEPPVMWV